MIMAKKADVAKEVKAKIKEEEKAEKKKEETAETKVEEKKPESKAEAKPAKEEKKPEKKPEAKKELKKPEEVLEEKVITLSLREAWKAPRNRRAKAAVRVLKEQLKRHIKKDTKIELSVNKAIWKRGIKNPPRKIKLNVKVYKDFARAYFVE
jgi:large subunit ribosomal protein L31e